MGQLYNWHWLSIVVKGLFGVVILLLSAILSYSFFYSIQPAGMEIFPFVALSLTEGGVVGWVIIFTTMKHHRIKGLIAGAMILFCIITTLVVTFAELIVLFQDHSLVSNETVKNGTLILLEFMLGMHMVAAISDFLIGKVESLLAEFAPVLHKNVTEVEGNVLVPLPAATSPKNGKNGVAKTAVQDTSN